MDINKWVSMYKKFKDGEGVEPPILVLTGRSGCGKSRWLQHISEESYYNMYNWDKDSLYICQMGKNSLIEIEYFWNMTRATRTKILNQVTPEKLFIHVPYEGIREMKKNFVPVFTIQNPQDMPYEFQTDSFFICEFTNEMKEQIGA